MHSFYQAALKLVPRIMVNLKFLEMDFSADDSGLAEASRVGGTPESGLDTESQWLESKM
jgi:hypothetical protein